MNRLTRLYGALISGLAGLAGVLLAAIVVVVVADVILRGAGFQPPAFTAAFSEYALLFATMAAAPWLVRTRGHIIVESLILILPKALRRALATGVYALCLGLCLVLAYFATTEAVASLLRGDIDIRAVDMPRWTLFAALVGGFALMAVEFLRLALGHGSLYVGRRGEISDGL